MTVKIKCLSKVVSKLTHAMGINGNESIINKEKIIYQSSVKDVPIISGNALRHKLVREPGALYLVDQLGLSGKLNVDQANYLLTGGGLTKSSIYDNLKKIAELQRLFPLYRLLGGCLPDQIIGGSLFVLYGVLVCEENRERLKLFLTNEILPNKLLGYESFITSYQYTRGDIKQKKVATEWLKSAEEEKKEKQPSNLMIYNGQAIMPGAYFYHEFIIDNASGLELGALLHCLQLWENSGGTIGGSKRIGHGKLNTEILIDIVKGDNINISDSVLRYIEHVEKNKKQCVEWLNSTFGN